MSERQLEVKRHQGRAVAVPSGNPAKQKVNKGGRPRLRPREASCLVSTSLPESIYNRIPDPKPKWLRQVILEKLLREKKIKMPKGELNILRIRVMNQNKLLEAKAKIREIIIDIVKPLNVSANDKEVYARQMEEWRSFL